MKFLTLFFLTSIAYSEVSVVNKSKGNIFLQAKNCDVLKKNFNAIKQWNFDKKDLSSTSASCSCSENKCEVSISEVLPNHIKQLEGKKTKVAGPNCLNTALYDQGLVESRRISTDAELKFWVENNFCKPIPINEKISAGDLYTIHHGEGDFILHGFTYISEDLVFSKGGPQVEAPFELASLETMFNYYKVPKECWHVEDRNTTNCSKYGIAYRCESYEEILGKKKINGIDLQNVILGLDMLSHKIEKMIFSGESSITQPKISLKSNLEKFRINILDNRDRSDLTENEKFYWQMIWLRFQAMVKQLN